MILICLGHVSDPENSSGVVQKRKNITVTLGLVVHAAGM
jgi:hypothetical protein